MTDNSQLPNAGLWRRLAAMVYDIFLLVGLSFCYGICALLLRSVVFPSPNSELEQPGILFQLGWIIVLVSFYVYFWSKGGQTLGMRAWRLKLVPEQDKEFNIYRGILRCALASISFAALGLGYLWCLIDRKSLTLHDRLSHTRVIVLPKEK